MPNCNGQLKSFWQTNGDLCRNANTFYLLFSQCLGTIVRISLILEGHNHKDSNFCHCQYDTLRIAKALRSYLVTNFEICKN